MYHRLYTKNFKKNISAGQKIENEIAISSVMVDLVTHISKLKGVAEI